MIDSGSLTRIGRFGKPHGINGEINLIVDYDIELSDLSCIILDVDGINVPFFFSAIRKRGVDSYLVFIDGINTEHEVSMLVNKEVFALNEQLPFVDDEEEEDGFYAEDLIGYKVHFSGYDKNGEIVDVDDNTENVLFIIRTDDGKLVYIPVANEFISDINGESREVVLDVPDGIMDL